MRGGNLTVDCVKCRTNPGVPAERVNFRAALQLVGEGTFSGLLNLLQLKTRSLSLRFHEEIRGADTQ